MSKQQLTSPKPLWAMILGSALALTWACSNSESANRQHSDQVATPADSGDHMDPADSTKTSASVPPSPAIGTIVSSSTITSKPTPELPKIGVRNYEQINRTMATLTGIPTSTPSVKTVYEAELITALPTENDVKGFVGSHQVAIFKLAVEYCDALVKNPVTRASVFGSFNFAASPEAAFLDEGKTQLADALITAFWGKDLPTLPPHRESVATLRKLIDSLLAGKNPSTVSLTAAVATGACVATLASTPVTLY